VINMRPVKILAVDDDPGTLEFYKALLSEAGYQVETAAEATAAIMLYKRSPADLLILDVAMPSGGGGQVFNVVRGLAQKGIPVIFVTGLPEKVSSLVSPRSNVLVFRKPVDCAALLKGIPRLLAENGVQLFWYMGNPVI